MALGVFGAQRIAESRNPSSAARSNRSMDVEGTYSPWWSGMSFMRASVTCGAER
jgi:hypothetical protein